MMETERRRDRRDLEREERSRNLDRIGYELLAQHRDELENGRSVNVDYGRDVVIRLSLDPSLFGLYPRPVLRVIEGGEMVAYSYATTLEELGRDLVEFTEDFIQ